MHFLLFPGTPIGNVEWIDNTPNFKKYVLGRACVFLFGGYICVTVALISRCLFVISSVFSILFPDFFKKVMYFTLC